jgi:hypothetical protein
MGTFSVLLLSNLVSISSAGTNEFAFAVKRPRFLSYPGLSIAKRKELSQPIFVENSDRVRSPRSATELRLPQN